MSRNFKRGGILVALLATLALLLAGLGAVTAAQASGTGQTVSSPPPGQRCGDDIDLESQRVHASNEPSTFTELQYKEVTSSWGCYGVRVSTCGWYGDGLYQVWTDFVNTSDQSFYVMEQYTRKYTRDEPMLMMTHDQVQSSKGYTGVLLDYVSGWTGRPPGTTDLTITAVQSKNNWNPRPGMEPMHLSISLPACDGTPVPQPPKTGGGDGTGNGGTSTTPVKTKSHATVKVTRKHHGRQAVVRVDARKASKWTTIQLKFRKVHGPARHRTVGVKAGHRKVLRISHLKRGSKVTVTLKEKGHKKRVYHRKVR